MRTNIAKKKERIIVRLTKEELEELQNIADLSETTSTISPYQLRDVIKYVYPKSKDNTFTKKITSKNNY